jgi:hypothetical protein
LPNEEITPKVDGKVLIYTESVNDNYVFKGSPSSFTGGGTELQLPLGVMTREIALVVFGRMFKDGADHANEVKNPTDYRLIIKPQTTSFDYKYNSLKNLGFAITPQTRISIEVIMFDQSNKEVFRKTYSSGLS